MKKLNLSYFRRKRIALTVLTCFVAFIMASSLLVETVWAAPPTRITNNNLDDIAPQIDSGLAVWMGWDGTDNEIYAAIWFGSWFPFPSPYGGGQLTSNGYADMYPQTTNGKIVWWGNDPNDGGDWDIYMINPWVAGLTPMKISTNPFDDEMPEIDDDGIITWMGSDGNDFEIWWADGKLATTSQPPPQHQITFNSGTYPSDIAPQIDYGIIVWMSGGGNYWNIYWYDTGTAPGHTVTGPNALTIANDHRYPQIDDGKIVWSGYQWGILGYRIWLYDINNPGMQQISPTTAPYGDAPQIDNGKIVWQGWDSATSTFEIWFRDLNQLFPQRITTDATAIEDRNPQIDGGMITWMRWSPGPGSQPATDWEIWYSDTVNLPKMLYNNLNSEDDMYPQIWDGTLASVPITTTWVVWYRWVDPPGPSPANWEIYAGTP